MKTYNNPTWWTAENDSAWERAKAAFKRDWDQTKHDFGGNEPDTRQNVTDTVKQTVGTEVIPPRHKPNYDELEPAYRFGYGAHEYYADEYPEWNEELEDRLKEDWELANPSRDDYWTDDLKAIRHAWDYKS